MTRLAQKENLGVAGVEKLPGFPPEKFGRDALEYGPTGDVRNLSIKLNGHQFHLPRLDVGPPGDSWDTIFYLNISKSYDPVLHEEAATWFAQQFVRDNVKIVVSPPSQKSAECISLAVSRANEMRESLGQEPIHLIQLVGGAYETDVADAQENLRDFYHPITTPEGKHMGMKKVDAQHLQRVMSTYGPAEAKIAIADDVWSTGRTISAMEGILGRATGGLVRPHTYVLARESPEPFEPLPADVTAAMYILEIKGGISPKLSAMT